MATNHRETILALEQISAAKRGHLRDTLTVISGRSPLAAAGSFMRDRLSSRAREAVRGIKPRFRGQFGLWATAVIGTGLAFELGRASMKPEVATMHSKKIDEPARSLDDTSDVSGATGSPPRFAPKALRFFCLAICGIASGYLLSAVMPRLRGEAELQARVSKQLKEHLREFFGVNGAGFVKVAINATGVSRYGAMGVVLVHLMMQALSRRSRTGDGLANGKLA